MRTTSASLACSLLAAASVVSAGDLVIRERTTIEGPHPRTFEATRYYSERKIVTEGPRQRTIIDLDAKTMTALDKQTKYYAVTSFDDVRRAKETAKQAFEKLPPEQQKAQRGDDVKVTTTATDHTETIADYPCKEWVVEAGPMHASVWTTDKIALPAGKREWDDKILPGMRGVSRLPDRFQDAVAQVQGVILRKTLVTADKDGKPVRKEVTEALSVKSEPTPAEMLAIPDGFTKWTLPGMAAPPAAD